MIRLKFLVFFSTILLLNSCALEMPEYRGDEKFKFEKLEGKNVSFTASAKVYNPNWFGIKIKPSKFEVFVEDEYVGTLKLNKKVKMKSKRESLLEAPLTAEMQDGILLKAMKYAGKGELDVRLKGNAKAGVFLFSKKIELDKSIKVPTSALRGGGFKLN